MGINYDSMKKPPTVTLRVRHYFDKQDWQQLELARVSGVAQPSIHKILAGKTTRVDFNTLARLAVAFRVHPGDLFEWDGEPDRPGKKY
jgi:DNA-binding Xre family transcriptional regulator